MTLSRFVALASVVGLFAGTCLPEMVQAQVKPPWEYQRYGGSKAAYARDLWRQYMDAQRQINEANRQLDSIRNQLSAYRGTGLFGGLAMGHSDADTLIMRENLRRRVAELSRQQQELELEWDRWCYWELLLGPLSDAKGTIKVAYLDKSTWPGTIKYRELDRIDFRIREQLEREDRDAAAPVAPRELGRAVTAAGATIEREMVQQLAGDLKAGATIASESGSFAGEAGDRGYSVGPFSIPAPCRVEARITGGPAAPRRWSLHNSGTGANLSLSPKMGARHGASVGVLSVRLGTEGTATATEATAQGDIPFPGELTIYIGNPGGAGPLTGGNFKQSFNLTVTVVEVLSQVQVLAGQSVLPGDRVTSSHQPMALSLPDGSLMMVRPNSVISFSEKSPGVTRVNIEKGGCRIWWQGKREGPHPIEVAVGGRVVRPAGTDFEVTRDGDASTVKVFDGTVEVQWEAGNAGVRAGEILRLPGGERELFDATQAKRPSIDGVPFDREHHDAGVPQRYGDIPAGFRDGGVTDGWLLEDPAPQAQVETPQAGVLRLTVPPDNDMWGGRSNAPRLLRKVTGDFDLEGAIDLQAEASNWVGVDFLIKSPGCYMGHHLQQITGNAGADYWLMGLCRGNGGEGERIGVLDMKQMHRFAPAPPGPVRYRMTRRGDRFATHWSPDGLRWDLIYTDEAPLPDTVWAGWVFKRQAWDGLRDKPGVFTVSDVRLSTAPRGTMPEPEWEFSTLHGDARVTGNRIRLSIRDGQMGFVKAYSGEAFNGDFDIEVSYDTGAWNHEPGQYRSWSIGPSKLTGTDWMAYLGCAETDRLTPARMHTDVLHAGRGVGHYRHDTATPPRGRVRFVREDGLLSSYHWKDGDWVKLSADGYEYREPVRFLFSAETESDARVPTPFSVEFTVDKLIARPPEPKEDAPAMIAGPATASPAVTAAAVREIEVSAGQDGAAPADGRLLAPAELRVSFSFADLPQDTELLAIWRRDGKEFQRSKMKVGGTGQAWVSVSTTRQGGHEPGAYRVEFVIGEQLVAEKHFIVTGAPAAGEG